MQITAVYSKRSHGCPDVFTFVGKLSMAGAGAPLSRLSAELQVGDGGTSTMWCHAGCTCSRLHCATLLGGKGHEGGSVRICYRGNDEQDCDVWRVVRRWKAGMLRRTIIVKLACMMLWTGSVLTGDFLSSPRRQSRLAGSWFSALRHGLPPLRHKQRRRRPLPRWQENRRGLVRRHL